MSKGYSLEAAMEHFQRILQLQGNRPWRLTIRKFNPGGLTGHQTTEVEAIHAGFDWQAGQMVIQPAKPLTELSPEDVEAIHKSAKEGQSWHAYKAQEKLRERALKAEARVAELEGVMAAIAADRCDGDSEYAAGVNAACRNHRALIDKVIDAAGVSCEQTSGGER